MQVSDQNQALANREETGMARIKNYVLSPEVKERFSEMMGKTGIFYLNQVLILVANNDKLQKCTPKSILVSAMRAASLRLSVDPGQGQAWIIPYGNEATFQLGYKGVYELAMRTHQYRFINVTAVYEGENVRVERMTGMHHIEGKPITNRVIGWMLYFQFFDSAERTFYMTVEEIEDHAKHYSQSYRNPKSAWHDPRERPKMEKKTVLVNGLKQWGRFNGDDVEILNEINDDQRWIDPDTLPEENAVSLPTPAPVQTPEEIERSLGYDPQAPRAKADPETGELPPEEPPYPEEPPDPPTSSTINAQAPALRWAPETLKAKIAATAKTYAGKAANGKRGAVIGMLDEILARPGIKPEDDRHQLLKYLTGSSSSRDIGDPVILAIHAWLSPTQDAGGRWIPDEMSAREAMAALNAAQPKQDAMT